MAGALLLAGKRGLRSLEAFRLNSRFFDPVVFEKGNRGFITSVNRVSIFDGRKTGTCHLKRIKESNFSSSQNFSVFNEFSKQVKDNPKSAEFQQSVKELNEKLGVVTEDWKIRTQKTAEKLYKKADDVWTEAEETSKKVGSNVREKISAAKEELKETFGLGNEEGSAASHNSSHAFAAKEGNKTSSTGETFQDSEASKFKESSGETETPFTKLKSTIYSASPRVSEAFRRLKDTKISSIAQRGYDIVKEELTSNPSSKRHTQYNSDSVPSVPRSTRTDIVVVPSKKSFLGEKWESLKKKVQDHPAFKRVNSASKPVFVKGQELAEDMRERWETSDNPVVHKIQNLNETVFGETAAALVDKEIQRRDPSFSLSNFLAEVQEMIRPVLTAYFQCDVETLKKYCSSEVIERCKGERQAYQTQGYFFDNKILHISDAEISEKKMMGSSPLIIVSFQTQQIYCIRDKDGAIKEGGKDTIQTVYYAWAMQQIDTEELDEGAYFPIWRLREMQQIGVQALI